MSYAFNTFVHLIPSVIPLAWAIGVMEVLLIWALPEISNTAFVNEKKRLLIVIPIYIGGRFSRGMNWLDLIGLKVVQVLMMLIPVISYPLN